MEVEASLCEGHEDVRALAGELVAQGGGVIVAAGGGGTLRAVVEGAVAGSRGALPEPDRLQIAATRMGSGNVLAHRLGVPADPREAMVAVARALAARSTVRCAVMRCVTGTESGGTATFHALTLAGFGQLGRVPADLKRWHSRHPRLRDAAASAWGIEGYTRFEYAACHGLRCLRAAAADAAPERVHVSGPFGEATVSMLSALAMNLPLAATAFEPGVDFADAAFGFALVPFESPASVARLLAAPRRAVRAGLRTRIAVGQELVLTLVDRDRTEAFLDEDPVIVHRQARLDVAGFVTMVGPCARGALADSKRGQGRVLRARLLGTVRAA